MFVVCHMLTSLDGKIDGDFFGVEEIAPALKVYGERREYYNCPAALYGTTTMLGGYSDGLVPVLSHEKGICIYEDWINEQGAALGNFIISVDPKGELGFLSNILEKKGRPAAHVIEALTQQVSAEYLTYLRKLGISYIFAGQDRLDCTLLLQKLQKHFKY